MSPEERQLLIQTHRMAEENNHMLRTMRRAALWGRLFHFFYWVLIIGLSVGAYYFVQPYIEQLQGVYGGIKEDVGAVKGAVGKLGDVGSLLQQIGQ